MVSAPVKTKLIPIRIVKPFLEYENPEKNLPAAD